MRKTVLTIFVLFMQSLAANADTTFKKSEWVQKIDYINAAQGRLDGLILRGQVVFNDQGYCLLNIATEHVPCQIQIRPVNNVRNENGNLVSFDAVLAIVDSQKYIEILKNFSEKKSFGDKAIQIFQEYLIHAPTTGIYAGFISSNVDDIKNPETISTSNPGEVLELISYPGKVGKL